MFLTIVRHQELVKRMHFGIFPQSTALLFKIRMYNKLALLFWLQEIAETELSNMRDQKSNLEAEIVALEQDVEQLQNLYEEQESILDRIFGGAYGSEDENHLESSLDQHEQMRNRIVEANFKWRQAQLMIDYAYKQLEHAVTKWTDIQTIDPR